MILQGNNIPKLLMPSVIGLLCVGCTPHELPEGFGLEDGTTDVVISLSFDTAMPLYQEVVLSSRSLSDEQDGGVSQGSTPSYIRYVVKAFRNGATSREPVGTYVFYRPISAGLDCQTTISLPRGSLTCLVWVDYVNGDNSDADGYYQTDDFQEIILDDRGNYVGNSDLRDTFRGRGSISIACESKTLHIDMSRPMAKYEFIATDLQKFLYAVSAHLAESRSVDLGDYTCRVHYDGYLPCSFNMFTDKPADAWTGMSYSGQLRPTDDDGEALLGYDYVFVNDDNNASVMASIEVVDGLGDVVARTNTMEIPLLRGHLTTVKGDFLTSHTVGGTMIDSEFNGEYNIFIHF